MPPTNVSFAAALDLGVVLPISNTQSDINDGGTNFTVFYKFTCPINLKMVWAWATSDNLVGYTPSIVPYNQLEVEILVEGAVPPVILGNNPIQFPVTPGEVHFLQVVKNADSVGPEHVDLQIKSVPDESTIPVRSIVINGDQATGVGSPFGIFSSSVDYQTIKFIKGIAIGEGGCITKSGNTLFDNRVLGDRKVKLYEPGFNELGTENIDAFAWIRRNQVTDWFWILVMEAPSSKLYKLNPNNFPLFKTLVATITTTSSARGISTNNAETIAYYALNTLTTGVKRWDLTLDVALSDLVANPDGASLFLDSLTLEDDTVIVGWSNNGGATGVFTPRRYSAAGVLLNTYGPFNTYEQDLGVGRLAYDPDSPISFWVKYRDRSSGLPGGNAIFQRIRVSDGVELKTVLHTEFSGRNYIGPALISYPGESGPWSSCPLIISHASSPITPSGIYMIVNNRRSDRDGPILATFKTALMP